MMYRSPQGAPQGLFQTDVTKARAGSDRAALDDLRALPGNARFRLRSVPAPIRQSLSRLYPSSQADRAARVLQEEDRRMAYLLRQRELRSRVREALSGRYGSRVQSRARKLFDAGRGVEQLLEIEKLVLGALHGGGRRRSQRHARNPA